MTRDELLAKLSVLPADTDIGIQLGNEHLDITTVSAWGDGEFAALGFHENDLRDVLVEWGISAELRTRVIAKAAVGPGAQA